MFPKTAQDKKFHTITLQEFAKVMVKRSEKAKQKEQIQEGTALTKHS